MAPAPAATTTTRFDRYGGAKKKKKKEGGAGLTHQRGLAQVAQDARHRVEGVELALQKGKEHQNREEGGF